MREDSKKSPVDDGRATTGARPVDPRRITSDPTRGPLESVIEYQTLFDRRDHEQDSGAAGARTPIRARRTAREAGTRHHAPSSGKSARIEMGVCVAMKKISRIAGALTELSEVDDEIAEEHFPAIDSTVKREAERILKRLARHPLAPAFYPTPDAEIAIHFQSSDSPGSVLVLLSNDGQVDCHAHIRGRNRHAHYDTASDLPDDFVREQLRELGQ